MSTDSATFLPSSFFLSQIFTIVSEVRSVNDVDSCPPPAVDAFEIKIPIGTVIFIFPVLADLSSAIIDSLPLAEVLLLELLFPLELDLDLENPFIPGGPPADILLV